jgi:hypothetical protein
MNLTTATPAEIDTELADLHAELALLQRRLESAEKAMRDRSDVRDRARLLDARHAYRAIQVRMAPLNREYNRRGGWTRAFLVNNANGHVHRSMNCSTTFISTQWAWLPQLSGKDEAEIVEAAGSDACTVCYPSAPVETLSRPRSVFSKDEVTAQAERAERDAQKAERQRQKIAKSLTDDGSELVVRHGSVRESFKTEQAATSYVLSKLADVRTWRQRPLEADELAANAQIVDAIAAKHGMTAEDVAMKIIEPKLVAKLKRDRR